jgi:hypothetical protein
MDALNKKYGCEVSWDEIQPVVEELLQRRILLELMGDCSALLLGNRLCLCWMSENNQQDM